jgi:hypothetical protein
MGLTIAQLPQGQHAACAALLQHHCGASSTIHEGGQQESVTAEARLLAGFGSQTDRSGGLPVEG